MADLVRRLVERRVPVILGAARPAPHCHMTQAPALLPGFACWAAHTGQPRDFLRHTRRKRMPVRATLGLVQKESCRHPMIMP